MLLRWRGRGGSILVMHGERGGEGVRREGREGGGQEERMCWKGERERGYREGGIGGRKELLEGRGQGNEGGGGQEKGWSGCRMA